MKKLDMQKLAKSTLFAPYMRYDCFHCEKSFEETENGMCPHCHSMDFVDKEASR